MPSAIVRQWLILTMLPKPPRRIDSGTIEARLRERGVRIHRRTIQRDLIELAEVFPLTSDERAKPYGWRWSDEAAFVNALPIPRAQIPASSVDVVLRVPRAALAPLLEAIGGRAPRLAADRDGDPAYASATVTIVDTAASRRRLFAYADEVEVISPRALREEIAALARRALSVHTSGNS